MPIISHLCNTWCGRDVGHCDLAYSNHTYAQFYKDLEDQYRGLADIIRVETDTEMPPPYMAADGLFFNDEQREEMPEDIKKILDNFSRYRIWINIFPGIDREEREQTIERMKRNNQNIKQASAILRTGVKAHLFQHMRIPEIGRRQQ